MFKRGRAEDINGILGNFGDKLSLNAANKEWSDNYQPGLPHNGALWQASYILSMA